MDKTYAELARARQRNLDQRMLRQSLLLDIMKRKVVENRLIDFRILCHESMDEADTIARAFEYAVEIETESAKHTDEFPND